jgi:hypothetical protein
MTFHLIPAFGISEDLLFLLVFAVFGLIKFISSMRKKDEEPKPDISDDEQARRTREIQDEIRRRIADNKRATPPPPAEAAPKPVISGPALRTQVKPVPQRREKPDIIIGHQIDYMEELAEARRAEEGSRRKAKDALAAARLKLAETQDKGRNREGVLAMLNGAGTLRDAYIINEVLMPPVSERRNSSCPGLMQ